MSENFPEMVLNANFGNFEKSGKIFIVLGIFLVF